MVERYCHILYSRQAGTITKAWRTEETGQCLFMDNNLFFTVVFVQRCASSCFIGDILRIGIAQNLE